jgi:hypothetical protein
MTRQRRHGADWQVWLGALRAARVKAGREGGRHPVLTRYC